VDDAWTQARDGAQTPTPAPDFTPASNIDPTHDGDVQLRLRAGPVLDFMDKSSRDATTALTRASFIDPGRIGEAADAYELSASDADPHDDGSTSSPFAVEHVDGEGASYRSD
jgi:hypothetical protein